MPRSEDVANMFMSGGREGSTDSNMESPVDVCQVRNLTSVLGFDTTGCSSAEPAGVDYDMKPKYKSAKAVEDHSWELDPEGKLVSK